MIFGLTKAFCGLFRTPEFVVRAF